jgi:hypothetical protein
MRLSLRRFAVFPFLFCAALMVPAAGHAQSGRPSTYKPPSAQFTAAEIEAVEYVNKATKLRVPHRLNLADDKQYAYVLAMLRLHGDSPQRSPQLYKSLEQGRKTGTPGPPKVAMGDPTDVVAIVPVNVIQFIWDNDVTASSSLLSSTPGGTTSTTMMINFRLTGQSQPFAISPTFKQANGGKQFMQAYNAPLPAQPPDVNVIASSLILTTVNNVTTPYSMALDEGAPNAVSVCSTAPNYTVQQTPPIACPPVGAACVNQGSITTPIKNCYGRTQSDCNYIWGGTGYPPNLNIAIAGSMTFPYPVDPSLTGTYILNLQAMNGGCFVPPNGGDATPLAAPYFQISPTDNKTLNFCFGGQLANVGCLTQVLSNVYLDLSVYALLDVQGGGSNYGTGMISSNPALNPNQPWFAQVPIISVMQGCFAPGTQITLADGTTRAVEQFTGDGSETVLADGAGRKEKVTGTGGGVEEKPLIRISDAAGHSVLLTETHPVITGRGALFAWRVRVGDTLTTTKGPSRVTKVETVPAVEHQKVHNLLVGEHKDAVAGKTTLFANDILVGDMQMQGEVFQQSLTKGQTQAETLSRLPKEWHRDYLNSIKNGTNRP